MSDHPDNLAAYAAGSLPEAETKRIMAHLAECDQCLEEVDALMVLPTTAFAAPAAPAESDTAARAGETPPGEDLEARLMGRIQRTDLGGRLVRFSTHGMLDVMLAFLRPFMAPKPRSVRRREGGPHSPSEGATT